MYNIFMLSTFFCVVVIYFCEVLSKELPIEGILTTPKLIKRNGYPVEEITVVTSDGYRLPIFRVAGRKKAQESGGRGAPVLLVHGMVGSSSDFIIQGPKKSLGYMLADAGYDVFLGNLRFTQYASHVNKSKLNADYWDFGIEESGLYDAPAMIEGVLASTNSPGLHYIGYSLGATSYMIACSTRPDLAARILSFIGLAPAVYLTNLRPLGQLLLGSNLLKMLGDRGVNPIVPGGRFQRSAAANFCSPKYSSEDICFTLIFLFVGEDYDQVDWKISPVVFAKIQPATIKQMMHYLQMAMKDELSRYDYGKEGNMIHYGTASPPKYNMTANMAPVTLFYGNNDMVTPPREVLRLQRTLGGKDKNVEAFTVPWEKFNHLDFAFAKDVGTLLNKDVLKTLDKYNSTTGKKTALY